MPTIEDARTWYDENDPVHGFGHIMRVLRMVEFIGEKMGADLQILRAAALMHDAVGASPAAPGGKRKTHEEASAEFAEEILATEGWPADRIAHVADCIRAHRYRRDVVPGSLEAKILFDADKLDVNGAFGAARTLGYALQAGEPFYSTPSSAFLETGVKEKGERHSAYHEYLFKLRRIRDRLHTPLGRKIGAQRHELLVGFFEQLALEADGDLNIYLRGQEIE